MKHEIVHEWFSQVAEEFPGSIAIESATECLSYAQLEEKSNTLANYLISHGATKGSMVAVLAEQTASIITAIIGILKAGCVFVPLDSRIPEQRMQTLVGEVSPTWFITESKFLPRLGPFMDQTGLRPRIICIDQSSTSDIDVEDYSAFHDVASPSRTSLPDDMCYVYFTSGSTGRPKGIAGRLKAIAHFINWEIEALGLTPGTRVSQFTTPAFDAYLRDVFTPLCVGGTVCVTENAQTLLDGSKLIDEIDARQLNLIHCVPSLFRSLINQELDPHKFSALRYILLAGEPLLPADVRKWMDVYGERIRLVNLYGPTETTMTKFSYFVTAADRDLRSIPIGRPIDGTRALVFDAKGKVCPPGVVGEIYIRTPYRTLGYYNQPELTREVFIQNPFNDNPNDIIYKTGDLGRILEDGNFEFLGRKDQQVKIRGVRIELREIEGLLLGHEAVKDAVVVDLEDSAHNKYLCAYLVAENGLEVNTLREFLGETLPEYMVPSAFVILDDLPRTISGKVDRRALPTPAQAQSEQQDLVAPRTPVEEEVARMWGELLGAERVSIHSNFFELGGHSLLATQLLSRVRASLGIQLPLRDLFAAPTIAGMALAITQLQVEQQDDEEMARLIAEIQAMPEDVLDATLNEEVTPLNVDTRALPATN
ncbi:MAG TPA: non-ribosomal peptide synthetase [Pyrinomonadaceae bacterium]|nr:non-ribosomal peptide synthetase [Pyrinomonadaceae bacterium]